MRELNLEDFDAEGANITCENGKVITFKVGDPVSYKGKAWQIFGFSRLNDMALVRLTRDGGSGEPHYVNVTEIIDRNGEPVA